MAKLRLMRQDAAAKGAQLDTLLGSSRARLEAMLDCRGEGNEHFHFHCCKEHCTADDFHRAAERATGAFPAGRIQAFTKTLRTLSWYAGLPPTTELKPQAEAALARLKQDVASKAAAARAAEQKTSATQALLKAAAGQLDIMQRELARLQQEINQGMKGVYNQVGTLGTSKQKSGLMLLHLPYDSLRRELLGLLHLRQGTSQTRESGKWPE